MDLRILLNSLPRSVRPAAIAAALPWASPSEARTLGLSLAELAVPPTVPSSGLRRILARWGTSSGDSRNTVLRAQIALIECWGHLPQAARDLALAACRGRWAEAAALVATDPAPAARRAVAQIARAGVEPTLVPIVTSLLGDPDDQVAREAQRAFAALAEAAVEASANDPALRAHTERTLADALTDFASHRAGGVASVAAACLDRATRARADSPLAAWFRDPASDLSPLKAALRRRSSPLMRARAWEWLPIAPLAAAAVDALARSESVDDHDAVLRTAHLAENPVRAHRAGLVRARARAGGDDPPAFILPPAAACVRPEEVTGLAPAARRGLARYLGAIDADAVVRTLVLERLLSDTDPFCRLSVAARGPDRLLADLCFDPDPCVARTAALRRSSVGTRDRAASAQMPGEPAGDARAPQAFVRRIAREDAEAPWAATPAARVWWKRRMMNDPERTIDLIRAALSSPSVDRTAREAAPIIARMLGVGAALEEELATLVSAAPADDVARASASAVSCLAHVASPGAARTIERALDHPNTRVRANAVEGLALAARSEPAPARLIEVKLSTLRDDPHHRVRANALRGMIAGGLPAAEAVCGMMRDDRRAHRLAGAWLASRLVCGRDAALLGPRWYDLLVELKRQADGPDDAIRRRAEHALRVTEKLRAVREAVA